MNESVNLKGKKIFLGVSGGVDSAVSAHLLKKAGAQVTGVFIQGWYPPYLSCTWAEDRRDAMRVCAKLGIPFTTLDASHEYKASVIDYIIREYKAGRTPNPDIMCNRDIKFGVFETFRQKYNADYIATGHYAQAIDGKLYRGVDDAKDQSYFLWAVSKEVLAHVLFPLGNMHKSDVRLLAKRYGLPVASKKDSQGICFLGNVSLDEFLRHEIDVCSGNAVDLQGKKVGIHDGALVYTIGERVVLQEAEQGPWYVVAKDLLANTLTVSKTQHAMVPASKIQLQNVHLMQTPRGTVQAQYRYHGPQISGVFDTNTQEFSFDHTTNVETFAPGQSLVFYQQNQCLGGGIIE